MPAQIRLLMCHDYYCNGRAGHLPDPDAAGRVFLKLPINAFG